MEQVVVLVDMAVEVKVLLEQQTLEVVQEMNLMQVVQELLSFVTNFNSYE